MIVLALVKEGYVGRVLEGMDPYEVLRTTARRRVMGLEAYAFEHSLEKFIF